MTAPSMMLPQSASSPTANRSREGGAVTLLRIFAVVLLVTPTSVTIGFIGAIAFPSALLAIALAGLYIAWVLLGQHDPRRRRYPTRWTFAMLWVASLLSYLAAQHRELTTAEVNGADRWILLLLALSGVAFVAAEGIRTVEGLLRVVRAIVWGGAICGLVALVQYWLSIDPVAFLAQNLVGFGYNDALGGIQQRSVLNRVPGTTLHPIELGAVTTLILPLAVAIAVIDRHRPGWVRFVPLLLVTAGVPTSVSRSAVLALAVALLVFCAQVGPVLRLAIMTSLLPGLAAVFILFPGLLNTLATFITGASADTSILTRTDDYGMVETMARERPWFGQGGGTYLPADLLRILDNTYLTAVVELGLVGLVVIVVWWFALPVATAVVTRRRARDPRVALVSAATSAGLAATAVSALTFDSLSFPTLALLQAMVIGLVGAAWQLQHSAPEQEGAVPEEDTVETLAMIRALRRNRRLVLPVAALTLLGALMAALFVPTTHSATATLLVQPPPAAPTDEQLDAEPRLQGLNADNPFTRRFDPATMIAMMSMPLTEEPERDRLEEDGATGRFSIDQVVQYGEGTAFARVTTWGATSEEAIRTAEVVSTALQDELYELQQDPGPSDRYLISAPIVQEASAGGTELQRSTRVVLLVVVLGLAALVVAVSVGDAQRQLRRERAESRSRARGSSEPDDDNQSDSDEGQPSGVAVRASAPGD